MKTIVITSLLFLFNFAFSQVGVIDLVNDKGSETLTGFLQANRLGQEEMKAYIAPSIRAKRSIDWHINGRSGVQHYLISDKSNDNSYEFYYYSPNIKKWFKLYIDIREENSKHYIFPKDYKVSDVYLTPWYPKNAKTVLTDKKFKKKVYDYGSLPPLIHSPGLLRSKNYKKYANIAEKTDDAVKLIKAYSDVFVMLMKEKGFNKIHEYSGVITPSKGFGKIKLSQKKDREYLFFLLTDKNKPVKPTTKFYGLPQSNLIVVNDFLRPYEFDNSLFPEKVKISREFIPAEADQSYEIEIFNQNNEGFAAFYVFEK